ncbi:PREDICTED: uncharacterized protein K02A2.6-like [Cyphomyrmex costatus]|uniref:uncharacterized protein K02A2.6-like n=1 Tax=Cyphomyrmex costatus TaxID=456900 RepID=UPI0008522ECB|nr:PREDICTED: uncharacterized protein K02A2.6-like [Cyphomyrmex costatus]
MKGIARSFVFWPSINADIEQVAKSCTAKHAHLPPKCKDHHWEYPKGPWERIHIDYAGPVAGAMLLIVVDAYSKWVEVRVTHTTTTTATIAMLDNIFASYGVPTTIVSDNGTQFTAEEFKTFLQSSGVKYHKRIALYHPATNGQTERYVQTVKNALATMGTTPGSLQSNLNQFLQQYRKAPHVTTGQSPAQLFLGRNIRTRIDLVRPDNLHMNNTEKRQATLNLSFREFQSKQTVYFLSSNPRLDKWVKGRIVSRLGDLHYEIDYEGRRFKRHVDHIRAFSTTVTTRTTFTTESVYSRGVLLYTTLNSVFARVSTTSNTSTSNITEIYKTSPPSTSLFTELTVLELMYSKH